MKKKSSAKSGWILLDFDAKVGDSVDTELIRKIKKYSFFRLKHFIRRPTLKGFVLLTKRFYRRKRSIFLRFASEFLGLYLQAFET
jgi:hypothetical protein